MKNLLLSLFVAGSALGWTLTHAATINGKVTAPNGTTPMDNSPVYFYRFNPNDQSYQYYDSVYTDSTGAFAWNTQALGSYLIIVARQYYGSLYPFEPYNYWDSYDQSAYYPETYNDVTPSTPDKSPTPINITNSTQTFDLDVIKLNRKSGCSIVSPITINGTEYSSFYSGWGPQLPSSGGILSVSFMLQNLTSKSLTTSIQPVAFLVNTGKLAGYRSTKSLLSTSVTLSANAKKMITFDVDIPSTLMGSEIGNGVAFNLGLQAVNASSSLANCLDLVMFPVGNSASPSLAADSEASPSGIIPFKIAADGKTILEWGDLNTQSTMD